MKRTSDLNSTGTIARAARKGFVKRNKKRPPNSGTMSTAMVHRMIDSRVNSKQEKKFFDTLDTYDQVSTVYPYDDAEHIVSLSEIPNDVTDSGRIGDSIILNSIEINYMIYSPNVTTQSPGFFIRFTVFQWDDNDPPAAAAMLESVNPFENLISPFRHDYKGLRKIYYDKKLMFFDDRTTTTFRTSENVHIEKEFVDLRRRTAKQRTISFLGGGTTGYNKVWAQITSNISLAAQAAAAWIVRVYFRINYTDS